MITGNDKITKKLDTLTIEGRRILRNRDLYFLDIMKQQEKEWDMKVLKGEATMTEVEETKVYHNIGKSRYVIDGSNQTFKRHYEIIK